MTTRQVRLTVTTLALLSAFGLLPSAFGQGSLTPPGAPSPTMKSLAQIEPRIAITNSSTAVTISQPGSYYLTANLAISSGTAITIATNGVTLDLNGFTISSTAASAAGYGIIINSGLRNITLANGFIQGGVTNNGSGVYSGSGFGYGIMYSGTLPVNVLVSRVSVSGCLLGGIYLYTGDSTVVESCTVRTVGSYGIFASIIKASSAVDCGYHAIFGEQVSDCRGESTSGGCGVGATTAQNCYGYSSSSYGVYAATTHNCYGSSSSYYGVYATTAHNCYGYSSSGTGVYTTAAENCYGSSGGSSEGVYAVTAQNCYGSTSGGNGIYAYTAVNCYGSSSSLYGVYASRTAIGCHGSSTTGTGLYAQNAATCTGSRSSGTAIQATIANGCYATAGTNNITYKYNMP